MRVMSDILTSLYGIIHNYFSWVSMPKISVTDIVEIFIITVVVYHVLLWVKNTRAWTLFKGLLLVLVFVILAALFQMTTILWIAEKTLSVGLTALVIIFQPELRRALEELGRKNLIAGFFNFNTDEQERFSERTIQELVKAAYEMGKVKTGALIVVEKDVSLMEFERTGIDVDGLVTCQLLINIFEKNTPLHDGAVLIRGDRVASATCYLPLSDNMEISKELGTRHRAALGVSEVSDSLTIVVSEETGKVSLANNGVLYRNVDADFLKNKLSFMRTGIVKKERFVSRVKRRVFRAKETR